MGAPRERTIVWFRRDLRIADNPALFEAAQSGVVIPVYVWCPEEEGQFQPGRASRWWLKQSLLHLDSSLRAFGCKLILRKSHDTLSALVQVARAVKATRLFYNHLYDPVSLVRDHRVKQGLTRAGVLVYSFAGDLLFEPWEVFDEQGHAFTRFKDFWLKCRTMPFEPEAPLPHPKRIRGTSRKIFSCTLEELQLEDDLELASNALLAREWSPGWGNAEKALDKFLTGALPDYSSKRRKVDSTTTSLLSAHLHYGEISVRKVYFDVKLATHLHPPSITPSTATTLSASVDAFLQSLGFRDFSRYLIFNFPFTHETSLLPNLRFFPWRWDEDWFKAWKQGRTGYPLVDAGMRELWATGWLHNRMRIVVASFCVKFLQLPWRWGLKHFWESLLDADLEADILGWQYISGSLPDAHELDRMDHPMRQGLDFDPDGEYVRRWLPELSRLPPAWIHHPWDAPANVLASAGVELGLNYPAPIVDYATAKKAQQQAVRAMWEREAQAGTWEKLGLDVPSQEYFPTRIYSKGAGPVEGTVSPASSSRREHQAAAPSTPTDSQQQAAASILNQTLDEVMAVDMDGEDLRPQPRCCFC